MARRPSQERSRTRVERTLAADGNCVARPGVSVGTIYQLFDNVAGARQAVAERTRGDLRSVLEAECTAGMAPQIAASMPVARQCQRKGSPKRVIPFAFHAG